MPFCKNCGSSVEGQFCAKCGTPVAQGAAPATPPPPAGQQYGAPAGQAYPPPPSQSYPPPPGSYPPPPGQAYGQPQPVAATGMTENVAGALCYAVGLVTGIIFLALAPYNQSKFVRFHAFQSIFFHVAFIALWVVELVLGFILPWGLHLLISLFSLVLWLGGLVVWILLMVKAYQNQKFKLPVIGGIAEQQS